MSNFLENFTIHSFFCYRDKSRYYSCMDCFKYSAMNFCDKSLVIPSKILREIHEEIYLNSFRTAQWFLRKSSIWEILPGVRIFLWEFLEKILEGFLPLEFLKSFLEINISTPLQKLSWIPSKNALWIPSDNLPWNVSGIFLKFSSELSLKHRT